ncbi:MAG: type I polyketide synthase, partial [Candidatus Hydrogenedentota bacterium]
ENRRLFSQFQPNTFWDPADPADVHQDHKAILFGQVALGSAVTELIERFGVRPSAVIGYSLGETAGLVATRAWTARDEMLRRVNDSTLFTEDLAGECKAVRRAWKLPSHKTVDWALGIIDRPAKVVRAAMQDHKKVYSLAVNTLQECVVGGDVHAVERLVKKLDCEFFPLQGVTTVHCEVAKEVQVPYRDLHLLDTTPPRGIRYYSGAWGTAYNVSRESAADSVLAQAIYGIDYPKMLEAAYYDGARVLLEMGPGASCTRMIGEILRGRPHLTKALCYAGQDPVSLVLRCLAALIADRVAVDLSVLYGQETFAMGLAPRPKPTDTIRINIGGAAFTVPAPPVRPRLHPAARTRELEVAKGPPPWFPAFPTEGDIETGPAEYDFGDLVGEWERVEHSKADAHAAYLRFSEAATAALADAITIQLEWHGLPAHAATPDALTPFQPARLATSPRSTTSMPNIPLALDRNQCLEFAVGSIAKVLGPAFAPIDAHPRRVRLPDEPLMLVDRVLTIEGEPRSMTHARIVTEHDVRPGAWYLDNGRIPTCIAVEAGQADLFLSGYLGIDFETRGHAVYRLLDAVITFHAPLPEAGRTIRYDIRIERFFRQGETHLFRFNFDATVDGRPVLTMRDGCAGFFTAAALAAGQGIVRTQLDLRQRPGVKPQDWRDLVPLGRESYSDEQLDAFRRGDLAACFGLAFANLPIRTAAGLPGGRMKLVDRILDFDPAAGRYGMGVIRGEMDVYPDDWFLTCHFVDDRVMPGTLMYECCLHTFRVMLARMGFVAESGQVTHGPVPGVRSQLKCRGQVIESTEKVVYEIELKEIGFGPDAYAIADALMYADGKPIVEIADLSVQLTGVSREYLEELWSSTTRPMQSKSVVFANDSIIAFAVGNPSDAFGDRYRVFDRDRKIARLPGPPYKFLDRITRTDHPQWKMGPGGEIEAEYDVPPGEWYFEAERQGHMPFAILLETALQPCGWFGAYMGSALTSNTDLRFRNLGGRAIQHVAVTPDIGTLTTRVKCTNVSRSGGMIIQNYEHDMRAGPRQIYSGDTYFGFFSADALANQVGLRDANVYQPNEKERSVSTPFPFSDAAPFPDDMLRMVDVVDVFDPNGGPHGLGFLRAVKDVVPSDWFFKAHFYQDPVWPGSLGIEAFVQLLKYAAVERWRVSEHPRIESLAIGEEHRWTYRGQVLPTDHRVTVTAAITRVDDARHILWGEGYLSVDGRTIYHMQDFAVRIVEP